MGKVTLAASSTFEPGSKVEVFRRDGAGVAPAIGASSVKSLSVPKDGSVELDLDPGSYLLSGEVEVQVPGQDDPRVERRTVAFTVVGESKESKPAKVDVPVQADPSNLEPTEASVEEASPKPRQQDVAKGTPQRSDTGFGEAVPTDPNEVQPGLKQEDVPKGTWQRSDTPLGVATPVDPAEVQPGPAQGDVKGPQRSDTGLGEGTPIGTAHPRGTVHNPQATLKGTLEADGHETDGSETEPVKGAAPKATPTSKPKPKAASTSSTKPKAKVKS